MQVLLFPMWQIKEILKKKFSRKKNERIIDEFRWVDGGWYSDKDAKPVPEKKIIEMRKELQAQMDYLNQFY